MRDFTLEDGQNWMSGGEITLTGLSSSINYSIAVAAVNENGDVGLRSESLRTRTNQCNRFYVCCGYFLCGFAQFVVVNLTASSHPVQLG